MRLIDGNGVTLATETFGEPKAPTVLLVMGATASMLGWPDAFCHNLAARGYHVIRFDHRDTGQSTTVAPGAAGYSIEDLAADASAILDAYGCQKAHVIGMSLGGYLAQMMAVSQPECVSSLTLIASEPLGWDGEALPQISQGFLDHFGGLASLDWSDQAAVAGFLLESQRLCYGAGVGFDGLRESAYVAQVMARAQDIQSMFNHAMIGCGTDWTGRFREIACPTLVLHGEHDPILPPENGKALAGGISGAALVVLDGVGHALPPDRIAGIVDHIAEHLGRVAG